MLSPSFQGHPGTSDCPDHPTIRPFAAVCAVENFDLAIAHGLTRPTKNFMETAPVALRNP